MTQQETKLVINKPVEQFSGEVGDISKGVIVVDKLGRRILIKKPNVLANLDFAKASGFEKLNLNYAIEVLHLKFVAAIDDIPVPSITSEQQLRALYQRLDEDGNNAVKEALYKYVISTQEIAKESDAELKNS